MTFWVKTSINLQLGNCTGHAETFEIPDVFLIKPKLLGLYTDTFVHDCIKWLKILFIDPCSLTSHNGPIIPVLTFKVFAGGRFDYY